MDESDLTFWVDPLDGSSGFAKGYLNHVTCIIGVSIKNRPRLGVIHKPFSATPFPGAERTYIGLPESGLFTMDSFTDSMGERVYSSPKYIPPFEDGVHQDSDKFKPIVCGSLNPN